MEKNDSILASMDVVISLVPCEPVADFIQTQYVCRAVCSIAYGGDNLLTSLSLSLSHINLMSFIKQNIATLFFKC